MYCEGCVQYECGVAIHLCADLSRRHAAWRQEAALELLRKHARERAAREEAEIRLLHMQRQWAHVEHSAAGDAASAGRDALSHMNGSLQEEIAHLKESVVGLSALLGAEGAGDRIPTRGGAWCEESSDIQIAESQVVGEALPGSGNGGQEWHSDAFRCNGNERDDGGAIESRGPTTNEDERDVCFVDLGSSQHYKDEATFTFTLHSFWQLAEDGVSLDRVYVMRRWIALTNSLLLSHLPYIRIWRTRKAKLMSAGTRSTRVQPALNATVQTREESARGEEEEEHEEEVVEVAMVADNEGKTGAIASGNRRAMQSEPPMIKRYAAVCRDEVGMEEQIMVPPSVWAAQSAGADAECAALLVLLCECVAISQEAAMLVPRLHVEEGQDASGEACRREERGGEGGAGGDGGDGGDQTGCDCMLQGGVEKEGGGQEWRQQRGGSPAGRGGGGFRPEAARDCKGMEGFGDWHDADVFSRTLCVRLRKAHAGLVRRVGRWNGERGRETNGERGGEGGRGRGPVRAIPVELDETQGAYTTDLDLHSVFDCQTRSAPLSSSCSSTTTTSSSSSASYSFSFSSSPF